MCRLSLAGYPVESPDLARSRAPVQAPPASMSVKIMATNPFAKKQCAYDTIMGPKQQHLAYKTEDMAHDLQIFCLGHCFREG